MSAPLTTTIPVRDRDGNVINQREVATYAGLLARAHEEGLRSITTELVQLPEERNGGLAVVKAIVETSRGTFSGLGDASPENVNRRIAPHILRMAETRAKARALRDAVNIGIVALEELGGDVDVPEEPSMPVRRQAPPSAPTPPRGAFPRGNGGGTTPSDRMTEAQRRLLLRILSEHGFEGQRATTELLHSAGVDDLSEITRRKASELIDAWRQGNGQRHAP